MPIVWICSSSRNRTRWAFCSKNQVIWFDKIIGTYSACLITLSPTGLGIPWRNEVLLSRQRSESRHQVYQGCLGCNQSGGNRNAYWKISSRHENVIRPRVRSLWNSREWRWVKSTEWNNILKGKWFNSRPKPFHSQKSVSLVWRRSHYWYN